MNTQRGLDSDIYSANGAGSSKAKNEVSVNLFKPDVLYGIYQVLHEPLHPIIHESQTAKKSGLTFEEAVVENLSWMVLREYAADNWTHSEQDRCNLFLDFLLSRYLLTRLGTFRLIDEYPKNYDPKEGQRTANEQKILDEIKALFQLRYTNTEIGKNRASTINNAFLLRDFPYSGSIIIQEGLKTLGIRPELLIIDKTYRNMELPRLSEYFAVNSTLYPDNLEDQWRKLQLFISDLHSKN